MREQEVASISIRANEKALERIKSAALKLLNEDNTYSFNIKYSSLTDEIGYNSNPLYFSIPSSIKKTQAISLMKEVFETAEEPCPRQIYFYSDNSREGEKIDTLCC